MDFTRRLAGIWSLVFPILLGLGTKKFLVGFIAFLIIRWALSAFDKLEMKVDNAEVAWWHKYPYS